MAKKSAAKKKMTAAEKKQHDRRVTSSEADRIEKGRKLAASYLEQRDGMDPETARMVVDSMEPEQIYELITEANTNIIENSKPEPVVEIVADALPHFEDIPVLANSGKDGKAVGFAELVHIAVGAAVEKNTADKAYKAAKQGIMYLMAEGKVRQVMCGVAALTVYPGCTKSLNADKVILFLTEKGVDPEVAREAVEQGWDKTEWTDVRIVVPKV